MDGTSEVRFEITGKVEGMGMGYAGAWVEIEATIETNRIGESVVIRTMVHGSEAQLWLELWKRRVRVTVEGLE